MLIYIPEPGFELVFFCVFFLIFIVWLSSKYIKISLKWKYDSYITCETEIETKTCVIWVGIKWIDIHVPNIKNWRIGFVADLNCVPVSHHVLKWNYLDCRSFHHLYVFLTTLDISNHFLQEIFRQNFLCGSTSIPYESTQTICNK